MGWGELRLAGADCLSQGQEQTWELGARRLTQGKEVSMIRGKRKHVIFFYCSNLLSYFFHTSIPGPQRPLSLPAQACHLLVPDLGKAFDFGSPICAEGLRILSPWHSYLKM